MTAKLRQSVQHLCQREVLFQGREWRCRTCYNRNWIGIGDLKGLAPAGSLKERALRRSCSALAQVSRTGPESGPKL
jgi:hypothetical protein